ncbi:MAG: hypothetical protein ACXQS8_06490 [Candidatus Helarchaeales archaeon]
MMKKKKKECYFCGRKIRWYHSEVILLVKEKYVNRYHEYHVHKKCWKLTH